VNLETQVHRPVDSPTVRRADWRRRGLYFTTGVWPILCAILAFRYRYDAPYWDEWIYVEPIARLFEGRSRAGDFWVALNEHILLVPSLITIPLARITHWDMRFEIALVLALFLCTFGLIVHALLKLDRTRPRCGSRWAAPVIALLMFSFGQRAIWTWGLHVCIALAILFILAAITMLSCERIGRFNHAAAAVFAWGATFSFAGGLAAWPAGLAVLAVRQGLTPRQRAFATAFWLINALSAATIFGVFSPGSNPTETIVHANPVIFSLYVLAYLGGPIAPMNGPAAAVAGALGAGWMLVWTVREFRLPPAKRTAVFAFVTGLASVGLIVGIMTALKHAPEGMGNAVSSRFLPWPTLSWCALALAAYGEYPLLGRVPRRQLFAGLVVVASAIGGFAYGVYKADERHDAFRRGRTALIEDPASPDLAFLHPDPELVRSLRPKLVEHELTVFRRTR
jgi:hypothetical protein